MEYFSAWRSWRAVVVVVFCPEDRYRGAIEKALAGLRPLVFSKREDFSRALPQTACAVVVIPSLLPSAELVWLRKLGQRHPVPSWLMVTGFERENVLALIDFRFVAAVVWVRDLEERLRSTVLRLMSQDPLERLAGKVGGARHLDPDLVRVVVGPCRMRRPPRTVGGLCRLVGVSEDRIRYLWHRQFGQSFSPKHFVDMLLLVRAMEIHDRGLSWAAVAGELRITEETLRPVCQRPTGGTLGALTGSGRTSQLRALVEEWCRRALAS
jgi:hypothetical protein